MDYQTIANSIIKDSIKSAVFIDENAREFFVPESKEPSIEEILSVDLYENFKLQGISLTVHKYRKGDETNTDTKNYLFDDRDLVLLDWKLDDNEGQEYALQMLADIVKREYIHFCAIYTSESNTEEIFDSILSYFSSKNQADYEEMKNNLSAEEESVTAILTEINTLSRYRFNKEERKKILAPLMKDSEKRELLQIIKQECNIDDNICALIQAGIAFSNTPKSNSPNLCPTAISFEQKSIAINNTIITILQKDKANDPENLITRLSNQLTESDQSFTELLGLEMQNILTKNSSFIDANLIKASKEAFIHHRNQYKEDDMPEYFQEFVKDIMLEKAALDLRSHKLTLLDDNFLDSFGDIKPDDDELIAMNVFYNSTKLKSDNRVNFGDVFEAKNGDDTDYYICITALCDCLRSGKIDNNFFFAKGKTIKNRDKALKLGDSGFISYVSTNEIVVWTDVSVSSDTDNYKPKYIKPLTFNIKNPVFDADNKVILNQLNSKGKIVSLKAVYKTTIKSNYAQRIANHAFNHPIRVGVDFVKKAK